MSGVEAKVVVDSVVREVRTLQPRLQVNLLARIRRQAILLVRGVREKLSGPVLRNRTGHLRASTGERTALVGSDIIAKVGVFSGPTLIYGRTHEFGFRGRVRVQTHRRTVKQVFGRPVSPITVTVRPFDRNMDLRERAYLRSTLAERAPAINAEIDRTVTETVEGAGG